MTQRPVTINQHYALALQELSPEHVVLLDEETPVSFAEFQSMVRRLVGSLQKAGVTQGALVGYSLPNSVAAFALPIAISWLGAACMPLYPLIPDEARALAFRNARVSFVVVPEALASHLETVTTAQAPSICLLKLEQLLLDNDLELEAEVALPTQPFLLTSSSGTTGTPKPVFLSQLNCASAISAGQELAEYGRFGSQPRYRSIIAFPQSTSGILILLGLLFRGVTQIFTRSLSPARFLELAHTVQAETISAPPAWLEALLSVPRAPNNQAEKICGVATGMDFLSPSLVQRLKERFPSLEAVANGYGLIETATVFMLWKGFGADSLKGSTSVLSLCDTLDNELRVCDNDGAVVPLGGEGELWVKGPSVIGSYLDASGGFSDGWFRTGDVVRFIGTRTVELRGRKKYLIKRGGKSVSPLVVQEAVEASPGVQRAAVVGIPHPLYGEMIWAFVVRATDSPATLASIMQSVRATLPTHMVPDRIEFVDTVPLGRGVGKVDREALVVQGQAILARLEA